MTDTLPRWVRYDVANSIDDWSDYVTMKLFAQMTCFQAGEQGPNWANVNRYALIAESKILSVFPNLIGITYEAGERDLQARVRDLTQILFNEAQGNAADVNAWLDGLRDHPIMGNDGNFIGMNAIAQAVPGTLQWARGYEHSVTSPEDIMNLLNDQMPAANGEG